MCCLRLITQAAKYMKGKKDTNEFSAANGMEISVGGGNKQEVWVICLKNLKKSEQNWSDGRCLLLPVKYVMDDSII